MASRGQAASLIRWIVAPLALLSVAASEPSAVVEIHSLPGVEVLWEGVYLAQTKDDGVLVIEGVPAGDYRVALRAPGLARRDLDVTLAPGERKVLEVPLATGGAQASGLALSDAEETLGLVAQPTAPRAPLRGVSPAWIAALLIALIVLTASYIAPRMAREKPAVAASPPVERAQPPLVEAELSELREGSPAFLEELKRRERTLEDFAKPPQAPPEDLIIEVEATEVRRVAPLGREGS